MMRWRIGAVGQTQVYLHIATVLFSAYMLLMGYGDVFFVGMLSVCLHEAAHAAVAAVFGAPPCEIECTPLGALMRLEDEDSLPPVKRLAMLLAGPGMSLLLCWLALAATRAGMLHKELGRLLFMCNLALVVVNLLPALPLDGGRIVALFLSMICSRSTVRRTMRVFGTVLGLGCVIVNLVITLRFGGWNLSLAVAGCFLIYAAAISTTTAALSELREMMDRKIYLEQRGAMPCKWITLTDTATLRTAASHLQRGRYTMFQIVETGTMRPLQQVTEDRLVAAYLATPGGTCKRLTE